MDSERKVPTVPDSKFITRVQKIRSFVDDPAFGKLIEDGYLDILNEFASLHSNIWPELPVNDYGFSGPENWVTDRYSAVLEAHTAIGMIARHYGTQPSDLLDVFISIRANRVNAIMNRLLRHDRHYCHSDKSRSHSSSSDLNHNHSSPDRSSCYYPTYHNPGCSYPTHDLTEKPHLKPDIVKETSLVPVATIEPTPCSNMDRDGTESNDSGNLNENCIDEDCNNEDRGNEDNSDEDRRDKDHSSSDEDQNQHQCDSNTASHSDLTNPHTPSDIQPVSNLNSIIRKLAMSPFTGAEIAGQEDHSIKNNNGLFNCTIGIPIIFGFYYKYVRMKASFLSFMVSLRISILPLSFTFLPFRFLHLSPC
jgi:hypothetical protein